MSDPEEQERPTKRRRLLMGLAQDVHPDNYRWSCRQLQERCMLYMRHDMDKQHPCWREKRELMEVNAEYHPATGRVTRTFFRCLRCGSSHICQPMDYLTCPRVTSSENPADYVCGFSGRQLGSFEEGIVNSGFKQQGAALAAMADRHGRGGVPMGKQLAREFTSTANYVQNTRERARYRQLAGQSRRTAKRAQRISLYDKLTRGNTALWQPGAAAAADPVLPPDDDDLSSSSSDSESCSSSLEEDDKISMTDAQRLHEEERQNLLRLLQQAADRPSRLLLDGVDRRGGGGGDGDYDGMMITAPLEEDDQEDEEQETASMMSKNNTQWKQERFFRRVTSRQVMDPTYNVPPVIVPQVERLEDNAYLQQVLDPVANYLATYLASKAGRSGSRPSTLLLTSSTSSSVQKPSPVLLQKKKKKQQQQKQKKGGTFKDNTHHGRPLWAPLEQGSPGHMQTAHQRDIHAYVHTFLDHYFPTGIGHEAETRLSLFCDRLLWTYHHVTGLRHGYLWPVDNGNVKRVLFGILTQVLVQPGLATDPVSEAKIPVWLPYAAFMPLSRRGRFAPAHAPTHLLPGGVVQASWMTTLCAAVLQCPSYSPHTLAAFLWPCSDSI